MKWYKRLFWKIFAAIWLVSVLVLLATVLVIGAVTEKERFRDVLASKAEGYAQLMVERYERKGFRTLRPLPPPKRRHYDDDDDHDHDDRYSHRERKSWSKRFLLNTVERVRVVDLSNGKRVVGPSRFYGDDSDLLKFDIYSESGRPYLVIVDQDWEHSPIGHLIGTLLSVQMVLVVLVSTLAAFLISAIIVRPLNRLREHTQAISRGELDERSDEKLSLRGDELGELAREFDQMAEYVQQTLNSHQKLLQDVSHELRAPLARLQVAAGLAEQKLGEGDAVIQRVMRETERLDNLIAEILSLSRVEQTLSEGEPFSLNTLLQELVEDNRFRHGDCEINLSVAGECQLALNRTLLERALGNLLDNACKHTPAGTKVDVSVKAEAGSCRVAIRDYGTGVPTEHLSKLCDPFYRGDSGAEGYGLGLSIVQRAISRLGGEVTFENATTGGLLVQVRLPKSCNGHEKT